MSSGFVPGGTSDSPTERDDEWVKAQQEIEANRRRREEESRQQGGKSLYEVLQSNKAAKEEAFQESTRLKNQFRNLDEDEVEFLDSVLESTRAKEQAVKQETSEQLDIFRRQQEAAEKARLDEAGGDDNAGTSPTGPMVDTQWTLNARKRKKTKEDKGPKGFKLRKSSSTTEQAGPDEKPPTSDRTSPLAGDSPVDADTMKASQSKLKSAPKNQASGVKPASPPASKDPIPTKSGSTASISLPDLGLAAYSSDED